MKKLRLETKSLLEFSLVILCLFVARYVGRLMDVEDPGSFILLYFLAVCVTAKYIGGNFTFIVAFLAACLRVYPEIQAARSNVEILWHVVNVFGVYLFLAYMFNQLYGHIRVLENLAMTCPLTGVLNIKGFKLALRERLSRSQRHREWSSVVFLDVDGFKAVNDTKGHTEGDVLLKLIAGEISSHLRGEDSVCRIGGDEFAVLLCDLDPDHTIQFIDRMKKLLDWQVRSKRYNVSFSLGAICYNGTKPAACEDLIHAADKLMYQVKNSTKDGVKIEIY